MILLIDNYDSFTYNIASLVKILKHKIVVVKNDTITLEDIQNLQPNKIILSPGPGDPDSAGITIDVIKNFHQNIPILGVCLGHQAIGQAFGGNITHSKNLVHGHAVTIHHNQSGILKDIPPAFNAVRYNSLTIDPSTLPKQISPTAWSNNDSDDNHLNRELMAIEHQKFPVFGVQFHPESYGTEFGMQIINNFCKL